MGVVKKKDWWDNYKRLFKRICQVLFLEGKLLWMFLGGLAIAIYIPSLLNLQSSDQITITASILQVSAFLIFGYRLNEIHIHYDPEEEGFWGAIKRWGRRFCLKDVKVNVNSINQAQSLIGKVSVEENRNALSNKERIELLEKDLKKVKDDLKTAQDKISKDLQNLESKLMDEVKGVETQMNKTEKKTKELQLKYLGRELVAVLWLISAAIINAFPEFLYS